MLTFKKMPLKKKIKLLALATVTIYETYLTHLGISYERFPYTSQCCILQVYHLESKYW